MPDEEKPFQPHITKKSKKKGWFVFFLMFGVPILLGGGGYWFQLEDRRLIESVRKKDALAPFSAWAIGRKGHAQEVKPELLELVLDEGVSPWLRRASAFALGSLNEADVTPTLDLAARQDSNAGVRAAAIKALVASTAATAEPTIQHALVHDQDPDVLVAACDGAGELGLTNLISLLIDNLETPNYRVRSAARQALVKIVPEGEAFGDDLGRWRTWDSER